MTTIRVTADHIRRGFPRRCSGCPLAIAIQEAFGMPLGSSDVTVTSYWCRIKGTVFAFDDATREWVQAFDSGQVVGPITAVLNP